MAKEETKPQTPLNSYTDPYRAYNFKLEIQGLTEAHFTQVSNLEVKVNAIPYREAATVRSCIMFRVRRNTARLLCVTV